MRQVVLFEALHFLTRDDLDTCQVASASWSNTVVRTAKTLPLRYIYNVMLKECPAHARVTVDLADVDSGYPLKGRFADRLKPLVPADDYADLLCLFDRSYVYRVCACLSCGGFLDYWLRHKDELTWRIGTIEPYHYIQSQLQSMDLDDACVRRIERSNLEMQGTSARAVHRAMRKTARKLSDFLLRATGLERCDIIFDGGAMDGRWIDSVIERFEKAEHSVLPVASLSVTWELDDDDVPVIRRLQRPSTTVAKPPRDDFVEDFAYWNAVEEYEESSVHHFTFRNAVCGKALSVYKWTLAMTTATYEFKGLALLFEIV